MGGAGGSWGGDYTGDGGSTGGSGGGGSWDSGFTGNGGSSATAQCPSEYLYYRNSAPTVFFPSGEAACQSRGDAPNFNGSACIRDNGTTLVFVGKKSNPDYDPNCACPGDSVRNSSGQCVAPLKCPAGYVKDGNKCIWQCPAGMKMLGGNCVKDDMPEDCDPVIQTCDEDGKPVCDCCATLKQLVSQNQTIINNDNRIISLTENMTSNQNTIINNTENINTNITTTNNKLDELINVIKQNNPDFDTTGIENKLDDLKQVLNDKEFTIDGDINLDMSETNAKLNDLIQAVKDNKYDDTSLKLKLDEVIDAIRALDLSQVTDRQDEQTGLLEQIRDLLRPTQQADLAPQLEDMELDAHLDPWSAIRGFNVNQNMINAKAQCPSGEAYSFDVFGEHFALPMPILCGYLGQLGVGIMFLAYVSGAFIIIKGE